MFTPSGVPMALRLRRDLAIQAVPPATVKIAIPPNTPPTISPVWFLDGPDVEVEVGEPVATFVGELVSKLVAVKGLRPAVLLWC